MSSIMHTVARTIPQVVWDQHREEVKDHYMVQRVPLDELMDHMRISYGFVPTKTQWKKQLKRWKMKRNLDAIDAAHILRLLNEALEDGMFRIVRFRGREKSREDIRQYISRTKTVNNEVELLAMIEPTDPTPGYITFTDEVSQTARLPQSRRPNEHLEPAPLQGDGIVSAWLEIPLPAMVPSSFVATQQSRPASNGSSFASTGMDQTSVQTWGQNQGFPDGNEELQDDEDWMDLVDTNEDIDSENNARLRRSVERSNPQISAMVERIMHPSPDDAPNEQQPALYAMLSATPAIPESTNAPEGHGGRSEGIGEPGQTPLNSPAFEFAQRCFTACIFAGQDAEVEVHKLMDEAFLCFEQMIFRQPDEILTTLNLLLATFDAHGHCLLAQRILDQARNASAHHLGLQSPITVTITYMLAVAARTSHQSSNYSAERLKSVLLDVENAFGQQSRSALTATYHVGWALLHENCSLEALEVLSGLRARCELEFGLYHIQTFSVTATLARVYYRLEKPGPAQELIADVVARVEAVFGHRHPYRLEALCRQAKFLETIGRTVQSETILYEVLQLRYMILGAQNPRTQQSFEQLRRLLLKQGKYREASCIYEDVLRMISST